MKFSNAALFMAIYLASFATTKADEDQDRLDAYNAVASIGSVHMKNDEWCKSEGHGDGRLFQNLGWMLSGYDLMNGDPFSKELDPGIKMNSKIFDWSYSEGQRTADCNFRVPDRMTIRPNEECSFEFAAAESETAFELSTAMEQRMGMSGGVDLDAAFKAKFSASIGFKASAGLVTKDSSVVTTSEASCSVYNGGFDSLRPGFHNGFLHQLSKLSDDLDDTYFELIGIYGTHFMESTSMGALYGRKTEVTSASRKVLAQSQFTVKQAAEASAEGFAAGREQLNDIKNDMALAFDSQNNKQNEYSRGPTPPSGKMDNRQREDMWKKKIMNGNPTPLKFTVKRLDYLDLPISARKKNLLTQALNTYCDRLEDAGVVGSCAAPPNQAYSLDLGHRDEYRGFYDVGGKGEYDAYCRWVDSQTMYTKGDNLRHGERSLNDGFEQFLDYEWEHHQDSIDWLNVDTEPLDADIESADCWCGNDWTHAYKTCHYRCNWQEFPDPLEGCPAGQGRYADTGCKREQREFYYCGINHVDAFKKQKTCPGGVDSECPGQERCFADVKPSVGSGGDPKIRTRMSWNERPQENTLSWWSCKTKKDEYSEPGYFGDSFSFPRMPKDEEQEMVQMYESNQSAGEEVSSSDEYDTSEKAAGERASTSQDEANQTSEDETTNTAARRSLRGSYRA